MSGTPTLQSLPGEILLVIHSLLSPASRLTFSMSCKRLYVSYFEKVPARKLTITWRPREFYRDDATVWMVDQSQVHEYMRARELCGFKSKKLYCGACKFPHPPLFFHPKYLDKHPDERICVQRIKGFWVEPGNCFAYSDLDVYRGVLQLDKMHSPRSLSLGWYDSGPSRHGSVLWSYYDILSLPKDKYISKTQIIKILSGFDLPTCPHVRLGDPMITGLHNGLPQQYIEELLDPHNPPLFDPTDIRAKCGFPGCRTSFRWTAHTSVDNPRWKTVYLHIFRDVRVNASVDPAWAAQLMLADETLLTQHWNDCFRWKTEMLAIEKERYINQARSGADAERISREAELRQRENMVDFLFHPRRSAHYPGLVRTLVASADKGQTRNKNGPSNLDKVETLDQNTGQHSSLWAPPTTPIVTSERIRGISLKNLPDETVAVFPRPVSNTLYTPLFTADELKVYYTKRG
ncbi:hypothetical protein AJ79_03638 [Helicocarpus griseus UAMH5409]|uniref:F-box domain-containing protein n=1 Tax=Helicocarpus griseus UAMH5409 TaxID=1447875 RepID=A0A2B7XY63_9EURO|nr:hypothetical protein AJ79_03638 [Helicocarpus griseus UAMH5409]